MQWGQQTPSVTNTKYVSKKSMEMKLTSEISMERSVSAIIIEARLALFASLHYSHNKVKVIISADDCFT